METPTNKLHSPGTDCSGHTNDASSYTNGYQPGPMSNHNHKDANSVSTNRQGVDEAFRSFGQLITASRRPLPTQNGDGTYNSAKKQTGLREDLKVIKLKGMFPNAYLVKHITDSTDVKTLLEVIKAKLKGDGISDDKAMIMERTIQLVAKLPNGSKNRVKLTDDFIAQLWNSLDHPPMIYVGDKYMYRRADGSFNVSLSPTDRVRPIAGFPSWHPVINQQLSVANMAIEHHVAAVRGGRDHIRTIGPA